MLKKGKRIVLMRTAIDETDSTKRVPDVYQLLLHTTPDSSTDTIDQAILFHATQLGYVPTISYLLSLGLKVDIEDATGRTPLSHAAQSHSLELLTFLLSHSASPNTQDKEGLAPLHWASILSDRPHHYSHSNVEAVKFLLEHGADPTLQDHSGKTALAWAKKTKFGNAGALELLKKAMEGKGVNQ
jgi:ankyrin repeat protein